MKLQTTQATTSSLSRWRSGALAVVLSLILISAMLGLISLSQQVRLPADEETLVLRDVQLALPPPPAPPPPTRQAPRTQPNLDLSLAAEGPALEITRVDVEPTLETLRVPEPVLDRSLMEQDLEVDWSAFGLGELDTVPQVMAIQKIDYPNDLSRRNIHRVVVRLDVFINEEGQVSLIDILSNPHPELVPAIRSIVSTTRFSSPTRNGGPVRARFIWPLEITDDG